MRYARNIIPRSLTQHAIDEIEFAFDFMAVQNPEKQMNELLKIGFFEQVTKEYLRKKGLVVPPDIFGEPVKTFELKVPDNYRHETYKEEFILRQKERGSFFSSGVDILMNECFSRPSKVMMPGEIYTVKIISAHRVYLPICLEFLKQQGAVLVGPQGLFLVCDDRPEELNFQSNGIFSLSEEELLPDTTYCIPSVRYTKRAGSTDWLFFSNEAKDTDMLHNHMICFFGPKT